MTNLTGFPELDNRAFALRLVRINESKNEFVNYEPVTFPKDPYRGCWQTLRHARVCGSLEVPDSNYCVDVLDENEDIIQELQVERKAFNFLKRRLKTRVDRH